MDAIQNLALHGLLPIIMAAIFVALGKNKYFDMIPNKAKQFIYGLFFGIIAIIGTEKGVPMNGAVVNVRDAAVLTAGLVFGGPAGIIAGLIGGIERYFAVYWGVGTYTQIACSVSTILAGFYSAALRKIMFDNEIPSNSLALVIGIVMEVFHISMVFLTNISDVERAMTVVKACAMPMIPANGISTMLAVMVAKFVAKEEKDEKQTRTISQSIQIGMLVSVAVIFIITILFNYRMQTQITDEQIKSQLEQSISDVVADVKDASVNNLLSIAHDMVDKIERDDLDLLSKEYGVSIINVVDRNGIVMDSTLDSNIGYSIYDNEKTQKFACLLNGESEYIPEDDEDDNGLKYVGVALNRNGFIQVSYGPEQFQDYISNEVKNSVKNKHVGSTGYLIVADKNLKIVSAPDEHNHSTIAEYGFDVNAEAGVLNDAIIEGEDVKFIYAEDEGYFIVAVMPKEEGYKVREVATYVNVFMEILAFAVLFAMVYNLIKIVVVANMYKVNRSLAMITDGELDEVVNVKGTREFEELSTDINQTVDKLKEYIEDANKRIDAEIQYAKNIQESALPHAFPNDNKYEIFALMEAAKGVGGDFYDFYKTTRHGVNFMIADVSGKGIPGAMFMMRAKAELHTLTETGIPVNDVFTYGNERLCQNNDAGMFVTAWEGNINLETGLVRFANAGHNPPVIMRTDGTVEYIRGKAGFVLAGMDGVKYQIQELQMNEGDVIFLYTDGVVEATNAEEELYGEDRLIECLKRIDLSTVTMDYLCCEVIGDVGMFVGEAEQFDDITMLALRYKGNHENEDHSLSKTNMYTLGGNTGI